MYLSQLIVVNYRSCRLIDILLLSDQPNIFIGVNDCGKTTILKSIGLLLDDKPSYHSIKDNSSKKDFSNSPLSEDEFFDVLKKYDLPQINYSSNQTIVLGKLVIEENDIDDTENSFTNLLLWIIEKSPDAVWLARVFENDSALIQSLILTEDVLDPETSEGIKLWSSTATDLNKRIKDASITSLDIENVNKVGRFSNLEKVRAIYSKLSLKKCWASFKIDKGDKELFPSYRYLDWNCSLDDIKKTAADAMAAKIETYLHPLRTGANAAAREVEKDINDQLTVLKDSISDLIPNITGIKTKIFFEVKEFITDILINKLNCDGDIHLDLQGEGIKRQIWFALIKAGALASIQSGMTNTKFIWAFDEPETHLYPSAQRQFFEVIKEVSKSNVQTLISTHSTVFIDKSKLRNIRSVSIQGSAYTEYNECESIDEVFESLELKNSDFLFYDKFLVIEGDTEAYLIPQLYKMYKGNTLEEDNVQLINLTGCSKWLEGKKALDNVLKGFKKSEEYVIYLFDSDMRHDLGEDAIDDRFFFAGKQDIEDSISNEIWINVVAVATENAVVLNDVDIDSIKAEIPENGRVNSNDKFFKKLEKLVKMKLSEIKKEPISWTILSAKGNDSAQALLKFISSIEQVSPSIKKAFDKLTSNISKLPDEAVAVEI